MSGSATVAYLLNAPDSKLPDGRAWLQPALRADVSLINTITVCTRPFRPQGPRLEAQRMDDRTVIHNYGHGGSGWSLSWGSGAMAAEMARSTGERSIGVIGCGALGLTCALSLQQAGAAVTIYAKELPPSVRSSLANGVWTPDSRICLAEHATPAFRSQWETMARYSWKIFQTYLGRANSPVEWFNRYTLADSVPATQVSAPDPRPPFVSLSQDLLSDLYPPVSRYAPGSHPLGPRTVEASPWLLFNVSTYTDGLLAEFRARGGRIEIRQFHALRELLTLRERTVVNATGYGARALCGDDSLVPVRGQLARMAVQGDIRYGVFYRNASFIPRRDGLVFQVLGDNDYYGYGDEGVVPDRAEAELAVNTIARLFENSPARD